MVKKSPAKKEGPESTRKLWKSNDASDDSSDDGGFSDEEDDDGAPPSKKVKQASDDSDEAKPAKQFEKEKGMRPTNRPCTAAFPIIILTMNRRNLPRIPHQAEADCQRAQSRSTTRRRTPANQEALGKAATEVPCVQGGAPRPC